MKAAVAVLALAAALLAAAPAADAVNFLIPGQKAFGTIGVPDEEDVVYFRADAGWTVTFTLKARKGETLLPQFTRLEDPDGDDALPSAVVTTTKKGNLTRLRITVAEGGTWLLAFTGANDTTGIWDLASKAPRKIALGSGLVATSGAEVPLPFDADDGTEATIQVKTAVGSLIRPLVARLERPDGAGSLDLTPFKRVTVKRSDTIRKAILGDNGSWTLVVTGAEFTTGTFDAKLMVGRRIPLDFTIDPPVGPPPTPTPFVASVSPTTAQAPVMGTSPKSLTVTGSGFTDPCTVSITAPSGTNGITNVVTTFVSGTSLMVDYDLDAAASGGPRSVTATNADLKAGTRNSAFTVLPAPTHEVTAVTPSRGSGAGGTRVLVQGNLFLVPTATVTFGGIPARAINVVDAQNILCTVPPAASVSPTADTPVDVVVDNGGGQTATLAGGFTYDADPTQPQVMSEIPARNATGVATNTSRVVLILSEPMAQAPITTGNFDFFRSAVSGVNDVSNVPSGRVVAAALPFPRVLVIQRNGVNGAGNNTPNLSTNSVYIAQIHSGGQTTNLLTDVAGNVLDPTPFVPPVFQTNFTTGAVTDAVIPTVGANPTNGASAIDVDVAPLLMFSEAIDPTTLAASVQFVQGVTPIPFDMDIDPLCRNVSVTPRTKLTPNTAYTVRVLGGVSDLAGNVTAAPFNATFTTAAADGTVPSQLLTVDGLSDSLNGSTTYAAGTSDPLAGGSATAFDAYLPLSGFTIDVAFGDAGGSGISPTSFSCTCSAAMGATGAGQNLASNFSVNAAGATWTVDPGHALATANGVVFTVNVSDYAGNAAVQRTLTVDVADITRTPAGAAGTPNTDRDPFNVRQSWLLRFEQDIWTVTPSAGGGGSHPNPMSIATTLSSNGMLDLEEDLRLLGLNGNQTGTNAASVTNGADTGTNAIVRRKVREAVRGRLNQRFGIAYDGTRDADSPDIEFLLEGEPKAGGGNATAAGWSASAGYSMMTFTGDERPNSSSQTIGRADLDFRNRNDENDSNTGVGGDNNLGTFGTNMIRLDINDAAAASFPSTFDPLIGLVSRGGTPVGTSNLDAIVLDDSFVYASGTAAEKARFDLISRAIDRWALYLSAVSAHEIGHSTGLVPNGAPPAGLFGNAHPNNAFVDPAGFTNSFHLDAPGPNVMSAAGSFDEAILGGSDFMVFEDLSRAYLRRRHLYDNGN